jgi:3-hydroxyacyl-CoA dehydrogenase
VLNEAAQLAEQHGVAYIDAVIGPHTGRAMPPLTTIDFVGWDVHKAIVDNLYANTKDEAHANFALPGYMQALIDAGHLGAKTPDKGGFFRREGDASLVLDPATRAYRPAAEVVKELPELVLRMKGLHRVGRYREAMALFAEADGADADLMRRVVLGYISYGLMRVGEVVKAPRDVDRIMGFGFNWAPPSVLVDVIGAREVIGLIEAAKLPVPPVLVDAAEKHRPLWNEPTVDAGRFFFA